MSLKLIFTVPVLFLVFMANGQIAFNNPSFEDEPADATVPMGWFACERGTTPDILPGPWGVEMDSEEGETFVGLITRSDGSFESIGQRLSTTLEKNNCYEFTLSLASCDTYSGFNSRVRLRIWAGTKKCKKTQLLYESDVVDNTEWKDHKVSFTAKKNLKYIIIEAYHPDDLPPVKGHILIDNISNILICSKV